MKGLPLGLGVLRRSILGACSLLAVLVAGCPTPTSSDAGRDAPSTADVPSGTDVGPFDAGPLPACDPDLVCPMDRPFPGTGCLNGLSCPYAIAECTRPEIANCVDAAWVITRPDPSSCSLGGFTPPAAERCRTPFMGTSAGTVSVSIPEGAFTWGAQGGSMLGVDLLVEGMAAAETCVEAEVAVRVDGRAEPVARYALRLRCGASHGIFVILSENPCEMRPYMVEVTAMVTGVGMGSTTAMFDGGQTSGPPVCPMM